jgi:hypothetical protein
MSETSMVEMPISIEAAITFRHSRGFRVRQRNIGSRSHRE